MSEVESRIPLRMGREVSRRNFLKTAAWTGTAFSAVGIGGFGVAVRRAEAQGEYKTYEGLGDAAILQFAYRWSFWRARSTRKASRQASSITLSSTRSWPSATTRWCTLTQSQPRWAIRGRRACDTTIHVPERYVR